MILRNTVETQICATSAPPRGITHLRDFPVEVRGLHLITGPPALPVNETTDETSAAQPELILEDGRCSPGSPKAVHHRRNTRFRAGKRPRKETNCEAGKYNGFAFFQFRFLQKALFIYLWEESLTPKKKAVTH